MTPKLLVKLRDTFTGLDRTISPGKGETAALPRAGHSARFSISGRYCAIEPGSMENGS